MKNCKAALEILALATVAALMAQNTEGKMITKCTLKNQLKQVHLPLPDSSEGNQPTAEELVAKIVCKVELKTDFNTSAVSHFERSVASESRSSDSSDESDEDQTVTRLYGLFELPGRVVCAGGSSPSRNICQMDCSQLTDEDIADDIACLEAFLRPDSSEEIWKHTFPERCESVVPSEYFSECERVGA